MVSTLGESGVLVFRISDELNDRIKGLGLAGTLPDLIRFNARSLTSTPAPGAALTFVFIEARGGGVGLSLRNRG